MTSQFETGIARGIDKEVLVTTPESELEKKYIGFPKSKFYVKKDVKIGRNIRMLACHSRNRTEASYYVDRDLRSTNAVYFRGLLKMIMVESCIFSGKLDYRRKLTKNDIGRIVHFSGKIDFRRKLPPVLVDRFFFARNSRTFGSN